MNRIYMRTGVLIATLVFFAPSFSYALTFGGVMQSFLCAIKLADCAITVDASTQGASAMAPFVIDSASPAPVAVADTEPTIIYEQPIINQNTYPIVERTVNTREIVSGVSHNDFEIALNDLRKEIYNTQAQPNNAQSAAIWRAISLTNAGDGQTVNQSLSLSGSTLSISGGNSVSLASYVDTSALSTWIGTTNITTLGTIATGTWNGTAIGDAYLTKTGDWTGTLDGIEGATLDQNISNTDLTLTGNRTLTLGANTLNIVGTTTGDFSVNTDDLFVDTSTGNVGIGTTSSLAKLDIYGDGILSGSSRYLNFGSTSGTSGYGFRDNAGTMQFKSSGGDWTTLAVTEQAGTTWTARSAAGNNDSWKSVTYGNGFFVAVGSSGDRIMTSPDGVNWTARSAAGNDDTWNSVTYGNGLFVAVGNSTGSGDSVMTSPDGIIWTARSAAGDDENWSSVTYGGGLFVAVAQVSTGVPGDRVITSPDGINWTAQTSSGNDRPWLSVTYGNGLFVAVGYDGSERVMTSSDGINWTTRSAAGNDDQWRSVTYGNGLFVAVGCRDGVGWGYSCVSSGDLVITSPDGITWTVRTIDGLTGSYSARFNTVTYSNGQFTTIGSPTINADFSSGSSTAISSDGITWTLWDAVGDNDSWQSVTYANGLFVAVGTFGDFVMTSGHTEYSARTHNNTYQGGMNIFGNVGIGTSTPSQMLTVDNGTSIGTYTTSGWVHSSDARLKANIASIENALDTIDLLDGVTFNWKTNPEGNQQIGFIAQDVKEVLPQVVQGDDESGYGISYGNITALLVNGMKEMWGKVQELLTWKDAKDIQLAELEARVAALEGSDGHSDAMGDLDGGTSDTPTITLLGTNPALIPLHAIYSDMGARALNPLGQELSVVSYLDGLETNNIDLDTSTDATYTITYKTTYNNQTALTERTVVVGDGAVEEGASIDEPTDGGETDTDIEEHVPETTTEEESTEEVIETEEPTESEL